MHGETQVTLRGRIGTDMRIFTTKTDTLAVTFRLATNSWHRDANNQIVEEEARWYTIKVWGRLADHVVQSVRKGQALIVVGTPGVSSWIDKDGAAQGELVIHAKSIGHDLTFYSSHVWQPDKLPGDVGAAQPMANSAWEQLAPATDTTDLTIGDHAHAVEVASQAYETAEDKRSHEAMKGGTINHRHAHNSAEERVEDGTRERVGAAATPADDAPF